MPQTLPQTIGDYAVLPINLPATSSYSVQATHHVYLRLHNPKVPTGADERSLFLVNVPIDSTSSHFRAIINTLVGAGRFESISFERERRQPKSSQLALIETQSPGNKKRKREQGSDVLPSTQVELPALWDRDTHRSGSTAVMVMVDSKSVEATLKAVKKLHKSGKYPTWGEGPDGATVNGEALGSKRYLMHHNLRYPDKAELQASIDSFMAAFNSVEEAKIREAKRARNMPDEDGFVTVTRGGRTGPARREDAEEARRKELEKEEEKRSSMSDFYRFQGRERRKKEQAELVKQFEEDRMRVEKMKAERRGRFRPE